MRIKLNEFEEHIIKVKDVLNPAEFVEFVDRLNQLTKMMDLDSYSEPKVQPKVLPKVQPTKVLTKVQPIVFTKPRIKYRTSGKRTWCDTREKSIYLLHLFYFTASKEERARRIEKLTGSNIKDTSKAFHGLKRRFNIQPRDLGLKYFPKLTYASDEDRKRTIIEARM